MEIGEGHPPPLVLDENGIAKGGVRTPWVDVPIARTSGVVESDNVLAHLFGSGEPFDDATRSRLYPGGKSRVPGTLHGVARRDDPGAVTWCGPIVQRFSSSQPRRIKRG